LLALPGRDDKLTELGDNWKTYKAKRNNYRKLRNKAYQQAFPKGAALDQIWGGDGSNINALLTVFRHLNACKYCNYAHHDFALQAGVSKEELAQLEGIAPEKFDAEKFLAITYARELANKNFSDVDPKLLASFKKAYSKVERGDIQTTARIIMLFSMICNTSDAFVERVKGSPVEGSRLLDELIVAITFFGGILPVVGLYIALLRGENPINTLNDFIHFSDQYGQ